MQTFKNIKFFIIAVIAAGLVGVQSVNAQKVDEERMNRDIRVAEKILAELFRSSREQGVHTLYSLQNTSRIRGTYVPNYGVLFRVPQIFVTNISDGVVYTNSEGKKSVMRGRVKVLNIDDYKTGEVVYWLDKQARTIAPVVVNGRARKVREVKGISIDSVIDGRRKKAMGLIKTFLSDYSSLLSQLSDNDKIVVTYDRVLNMDRLFTTFPEKLDKNSFMVSVKYGEAKSSRGKSLESKMKVSTLKISQKERIQFNVFKRILDEIFERRNTDGRSFYRGSRSTYTYLKDFGVIYDLRLRKPRKNRRRGYGYVINDNVGTIVIDDGGKVTKTENKLSDKERRAKREKEKAAYNKVVKEAYAQLEKDLKKHMVDYGRTLRSLSPNEMLMFNVRLSSSYNYYEFYGQNEQNKKEERVPRLMVMSIKMSDLDSNNAESKISIKKY
ncbi:hypothetical protein BKI52_41230 [marine bacterium AO1-C]|nr:hypothetical protein BKI52_41230 [marine bacterium AO1-C]